MALPVISEEFLQQMETLQLLVKNNVAGNFGGNRKTKKYGSSCEFADYRDYVAGDDITKIDWNVYARFDKLYQKLYLDERQMHTKIYIDASRSMAYGSAEKARQALKMAAVIAYLSICEMDRVSIFVIKEKETTALINGIIGKEAFTSKIGLLNTIDFSGDSYISDAIVPTPVGYGDGISVIISDFLTENNYEDAINHLADKKRDVICLQILSNEELNPLARGKVHFFDSENSSRFYRKNIDREVAKAYAKALEYVMGRIKNCCASRDATYLMIPAEKNIGEVVFNEFSKMGVLK